MHDTNAKLTRRGALVACTGALAGLGLVRSPTASAHFWAGVGGAPWTLPAHDLSATRASGVTTGSGRQGRGGPPAPGIAGAPLITGDRVLAASFGGEVGAFARADGAQLWLRSLGAATYGSGPDSRQLGFFGGLASCGDRVVVASDHVECLDLRTGDTIWSAAPLRPPGGDDYFWAPPAIVGGVILLGSGSGTEDQATRGRVSAYALRDGKLRWGTPL